MNSHGTDIFNMDRKWNILKLITFIIKFQIEQDRYWIFISFYYSLVINCLLFKFIYISVNQLTVLKLLRLINSGVLLFNEKSMNVRKHYVVVPTRFETLRQWLIIIFRYRDEHGTLRSLC